MRIRFLRRTAAALAVLATVLGIGALTTAPAAALTSGTRSNEPWVVEVYGTWFGSQNSSCTGTAIAADWVVTAGHCSSHQVFYRYTPTPGADEVREEVAVAEEISLAPADLKLLRLSRPHELPRYPTLDPHGYHVGSAGAVYGMADGLLALQRTEKVWVTGFRRSKEGVFTIVTTATTGAVEQIVQPGDSGGALIVAGNLVGVTTGRTSAHESEQSVTYADVRPVVEKLWELEVHGRFPRGAESTTTADITDVSVVRGFAEVTMSEAVYSGKRVVVWIDGRYAGDLNDDRGWSVWRYSVPGGTKIVPTTPVEDGDVVQVGALASGTDLVEADPLFRKTLNGVNGVQRTGDRVAVTMSRALVHSGERVLVWVNGAYYADVQNDVSHYASKTTIDGASIVTPDGTVKDGDLVRIGVVPDGTDVDQAEILDARVL